jgi:hypothetical protein
MNLATLGAGSAKSRTEVAPKKQTRELGLTLLPFELFRTLIAERLM